MILLGGGELMVVVIVGMEMVVVELVEDGEEVVEDMTIIRIRGVMAAVVVEEVAVVVIGIEDMTRETLTTWHHTIENQLVSVHHGEEVDPIVVDQWRIEDIMVVVEAEGAEDGDEVQVALLPIPNGMRVMNRLMTPMVAVDILEGVEGKVVDPVEAIEEGAGGPGRDRGHDLDPDPGRDLVAPDHVIDPVVMIEKAAGDDHPTVAMNRIVGHGVDGTAMGDRHRGEEGRDLEAVVGVMIGRRNAEHPHRHRWKVEDDLPVGVVVIVLEVQAHRLTVVIAGKVASQTMTEIQKGTGLIGEESPAERVLDLEVDRVEP